MANLNFSTQYQTPNSKSPLSNFSGITKLLQESAQKKTADTFKSALMPHYTPSSFSDLFGSSKPVSYEPSGVPLNEPAFPQGTTPTQPLPEGYSQFTPVDEKSNWVAPTDKTVARNWPSYLGGGQYAIDPTQPGQMIKSDRAIMDANLNPGAKQKLLGNLSPSLYQVDHIIPLWAGGADTLQNLEVLDNPTHEKKTAIQAVALTLLANKKIDLAKARELAFTWKDKDASGLPSAAEMDKLKGYVPLTTAEKMVQKWQDDMKPKTMKYFGESFKENMSKFGEGWLPAPIREFAKGLVGGATAGIAPGTEATPESGTLGTVSNVAGNIAGTVTGIGLLSKGLGATVRGFKALTGIGKATSIASEAMKASGLATDIGSLGKAGKVVSLEEAVAQKQSNELITKIAKNAGLLSIWGQIGLSGKEATGQTEAEFSNHVKQFFSDIAFGSLLGSAGQNVKGYALIGSGVTALSLMEGQGIKDSLQNAGIMTALHGMAYKRGIVDPKIKVGEEEAYKMSANTINNYIGDVIPTVKKGQSVPEVLKLDIPKLDNMRVEYQKLYPNDQRFKNLGTITNNDEAVHFIEQASKRRLGNLIAKSDGSISQDQIKQEMTRIVTAKNQLYNQTLPIEARTKKAWEDLVSMGQKLRPNIKTNQVRVAQNANENLSKIPQTISSETYSNTNELKFPTGKGGITGYGDKIDVDAKKNIDDFAKNPDKYDGKIYIPKTDSETAAIQRFVNSEYLSSGKQAPTEVPEHTLRAFIRTIEGEFKPVGYLPQEGSFNVKKYNLNTTHTEQYNRIIHIFEMSKNPNELKNNLAKDKSKIEITDNEANQLFEEKNTIKSIDPNELLKRLKPNEPYWKLDSNLNNTNIYNKMDALGIDNLVIDPLKAWEMNGVRPRYNPDNPYINLDISEQDWLRSIALKKGTPGIETTPEVKDLSRNIEKIVNQQKAQNTSQAINKVLPKVKASEITPTVREMPPKSSIEAPKTTEMSNTSFQAKTPQIARDVELKYGQEIPISSKVNNDLVDQLFGKIVHDIEYRKVKPDSPESLQKIYNNIIDSFKATNPGIPEQDFKNAMIDAKSRANTYVENLIDDTYKGTKKFGTEDIYQKNKTSQVNPEYWRAIQSGLSEDEIANLGIVKKVPKIEKPEYVGRDEKLAKEFGLKLQEPNRNGIQYLETDKKGNPIFSEEYLKAHPNTKGTPLDVWGSFLGNELKANKAELSLQSKTWGKQIEEMKKSKNPYSQGVAKALDKALEEKYAVKDPKTGEIKYDWHESWKLNSGLKKIKSLFSTVNEEGQSITQPFRRIMAGGGRKSYSEIQKDVAKADIKTRKATEEAKIARENDMISGKETPILERGMRVKDPNQLQDVSEDLTPYDLLHSGLVRKEARDNLIARYNQLREEMQSGRRIETRISPTGEGIKGTKDEMNRLFTGIKKLSEYIPESKKWKPGSKIVLKNKGEPTFEEGVNDGVKIAAQIFKLNSSPGKVPFDKIKKELLKSKQGGFGSLKAIFGLAGVTGAVGLANMSSTVSYKRPEEAKKEVNRISNDNIGDVIKYMESSGGIDKGSADKGEVKWKYGLTNVAIKELQRVGAINKIDINNEQQVRNASIKYFKLMRERHPELSDAEIYTDYYWGGSKGDQRERTIKKFNEFIIQ